MPSSAPALVTWAAEGPSGGNTYNRELVEALRERGVPVEVRAVPGRWPEPTAKDRAALAAALDAPVTMADAIVACVAPAEVAAAVAAGRTVAVLLHMLPSAEVGLAPAERERRARAERAALEAASVVVCPSAMAAADLARRYGVAARVAPPGARPAALAAGSRPPRLLALAALTATKDQLTLVRALSRLRELDWTARLVGPTDADPAYAAAVLDEIAAAGLTGRAGVTGPKVGAALEVEWAAADLLVLPSRTETFGLVVLEALAHGVPAVVGAGTGAVEALAAGAEEGAPAPGRAVPSGDPAALAATLRAWLTTPALHEAWAQAARARRPRLPGWDLTAAQVLGALG